MIAAAKDAVNPSRKVIKYSIHITSLIRGVPQIKVSDPIENANFLHW